ncbi:MAG: DUF2339 domain-containing protein, partial [Bacteroidia bacterium]
MEIFLLLLVIVLLFILRSNQKKETENLYKKIQDLEKYLQNNQTASFVKEEIKPTPPPVEEMENVYERFNLPIIEEQEEEAAPILEEFKEEISPISIGLKQEGILVNDAEIIDIHNEVFKQEKILADKKQVAAIKEVELSWWDKFKVTNPDLEKFIGENLISKIGVAILVLGIGFFVKYAIDQNWINETARAGIGILCGGIVLGFAHKLRKNFKAFSSVLAAGAIAIFYFTIAIAFHQYHLFSQTVAFSIMVVVTAFSILISISYDRIELAALSLIGGFAAPFMVSTGEGNYIALFTYIMILNTGMLVLAYMRKWNLINILTYIFTV